ncbi:hypothetical protein ES708_02420 [subsurface metagenome]
MLENEGWNKNALQIYHKSMVIRRYYTIELTNN